MQGKTAGQRRFAKTGGKPPPEAGSLARSPSGRQMRRAWGMEDQSRCIPPDGAAAFKRQWPGGARHPTCGRVECDYKEFRRATARMLHELDDGRRADAARHARYGHRPCPILRINLTQRVPYDRFKKGLESANIETISSATERSVDWVVVGDEEHAGRLYRQIKRRVASPSSTFVGAVTAFAEADPRKKLGMSLEWCTIQDDTELDGVEVWRLADNALEAFTGQLHMMVAGNGGRIMDMHRTSDTFVVQIACNAAMPSTVAALLAVVCIDRLLRAAADNHTRRIVRKFAAAGAQVPDAPGTASPGASLPPLGPALGRPRGMDLRSVALRRRRAGRGRPGAMTASRPCAAAQRTPRVGRPVSGPSAQAIGPPVVRRRTQATLTMGPRSYSVSRTHPPGAGMPCRTGDRSR